MSKIRLYGDTSGFVELAAPDVSDDGVLTLPTAAQGFGRVLQVVSARQDPNTLVTVASTSYTDFNLQASITPILATSTILVWASIPVQIFRDGGANQSAGIRLMRDTVAVSEILRAVRKESFGPGLAITASFVDFDAPNTTSAVVYEFQARVATTATNGFAELGPDARMFVAEVSNV